MNRLALIGLVAILFVAGCTKATPTAPTANVPFSTVDIRVGTGAEAVSGRTAIVNYTLWLYNSAGIDNKGQQIDTSVGRAPFSVTLGRNQVIPGFEQGLTGMKVGGFRRVTVPPSLGYGSAGTSGILPNATLIFEIELLSIS
jgi:FKBP-type peptidyl-prolyl cis-trans isomerase FkpA